MAGNGDKPNYLKFMPANSFVNIYDFATVESLAQHLIHLSANKSEYEKYLWYKDSNRSNSNSYLSNATLDNIIRASKNHFESKNYNKSNNETTWFFDELIAKESSENKLCKVARYLTETPVARVLQQINLKRMNRPEPKQACLPRLNIANHFNLKRNNANIPSRLVANQSK